MKIVNGSRHLLVSYKTAKRFLEHLLILQALEDIGEAGKVGNKKMYETLKERGSRFQITAMFQLAHLGYITMTRTFFQKGPLTIYPFNWKMRCRASLDPIEHLGAQIQVYEEAHKDKPKEAEKDG